MAILLGEKYIGGQTLFFLVNFVFFRLKKAKSLFRAGKTKQGAKVKVSKVAKIATFENLH